MNLVGYSNHKIFKENTCILKKSSGGQAKLFFFINEDTLKQLSEIKKGLKPIQIARGILKRKIARALMLALNKGDIAPRFTELSPTSSLKRADAVTDTLAPRVSTSSRSEEKTVQKSGLHTLIPRSQSDLTPTDITD